MNAAKTEKSILDPVESIMIRGDARFTVRICSFACGLKLEN